MISLGKFSINSFYVGDVLEFLAALPPESVPMFFFSPPYNLGTTSGGGFSGDYQDSDSRRGHGKPGKWSGGSLSNGYKGHDDSMTMPEYLQWQENILNKCWRTLTDSGAIFYNHKPRVLNGKMLSPVDYVPTELRGFIRQEIIWARAGGINFSPSFFLPTHERIVIIAKRKFRLKSKGASGAGDVWYIPQKSKKKLDHPAPFPVELPYRAIEAVMPEFVCDPMCGSGTTAVAAQQLGVGYLCNDNSDQYIMMARQRLAAEQAVAMFPNLKG